MLKTAEYVSLGHPDKVADFVTCYLLDDLIKRYPGVKYAVEVMVKDNTFVFGGEVGGIEQLPDLNQIVQEALRQIGYDEAYAARWQNKSIDIRQIKAVNLIGVQSNEILQGVAQNGWGDQGVFVGYACQGPEMMPAELVVARRLNNALYEKARASQNLGLDIKTQITLDETGHIHTAIVAIPMLEPEDLSDFVKEVLGQTPDKIIMNGTGAYTQHASIADCGITGRKLACDFYSTACPVGGGSPWTKDPTKADLTLNLYARYLARQYLADNEECFVYLSSCIGQSDLPSAVVKTIKNGQVVLRELNIRKTPSQIIRLLHLDGPVFTNLCQRGLMFSY